jgi:uridine kinase
MNAAVIHSQKCLLAALTCWIREHQPKNGPPLRVAVAGDGALGKSKLTKLLAGQNEALRLEADGYGLDRATRSRRNILHLEDRRSFNHRRFLCDAYRLCREGQKIRARSYNHATGRVAIKGTQSLKGAAVVFLDGSCLLEPILRSAWDVAILLDASRKVRKAVRLQIDKRRGYEQAVATANWYHYQRFYAQRIARWRGCADVIINVQPGWRYTWETASLSCTCGVREIERNSEMRVTAG